MEPSDELFWLIAEAVLVANLLTVGFVGFLMMAHRSEKTDRKAYATACLGLVVILGLSIIGLLLRV